MIVLCDNQISSISIFSANMSFANIDLEAQKGKQKKENTGVDSNKNGENSLDELELIIEKTSKQLHLFGQLATQFDAQRKQIGTRRDCRQLRNNIDDLTAKLNDLDYAINLLISNVSGIINKSQNSHQGRKNSLDVTKKHSIMKERLMEEYNELHSRFQNSVLVYEERAAHYRLKEESVPKKRATEATPLLQSDTGDSQQQLQLQEQIEQQRAIEETELQFQVLLTEEREREINQVTKGITEVNYIFKDLSELVQQQGEQLDTIEDNIFHYQGDAQQAQGELVKAHEYQKSKGKWSCIILVALCIIVLIIVLAVIS